MTRQYTSRTDRVRILILLEKKHSLSTEEFQHYFLNVHSKIVAKFAEGKDGLIKYEQLHVNQEERAFIKDMGQTVPNYDGVTLFDFESFDKFEAFFSSSEYISDIGSDIERFLHTTTALVLRLNIVPIIDPEVHVSRLSLNQISKDRATALFGFTRKEGISREEMRTHWLNSHAKVVCSETRMGREIIKYEQLHLATECPIRRLNESSMDLPNWDGLALIHAPSFQTFRHLEDVKALAKDNAKFLAPGKLWVLPVNSATIIDNSVASNI
ncbi:ethyl tert-butyl ether degradation [Moniliophthora roreri MCA 2997]|uniref:Ethyl tert-butyl ether degradation n=2 Tax=Moniliophthora roreri TaxID=221103 RepID=V2XHT2_MONRO|nr:ethyl tert-butyl ether degradation [Moniliophthora roreri MCA 2997]KAI3595780.1 ethyl tert-butyl ether degradation [Moniliophthora roreri]